MFIRNIITTSALVVLLGLTGGSAFAMDYPEGDEALTDFDGYAVNQASIETGRTLVDSKIPDHVLETLSNS